MASPTPEPFEISVPDTLLDWINDRVRTARIPPGKDLPKDQLWSHGVPVPTARAIHEYWTTKYDWRTAERSINNDLKQFTLPISHNDETLKVHFVHHRSPHPNAIPLLFIHGWPGSFLEVRPIINLLTHPSDPSQQAYHVVAPSLIGFGFSSYPTQPFSPMDQASTFHALMTALNYKPYMTQGGDWGSMIARQIAIDHPSANPAVHVNMIAAAPPSVLWNPLRLGKMILGFATGLLHTPFENAMLARLLHWQKEEFGYAQIQGTKSQTIQYALADSPFGFVCWIRDKIEHLVDYDAGWVWTAEDVITMVMPYIINGTPGHAEIYRWALNEPQKAFSAALFEKIIPRTSFFGASIFPKDVTYATKYWAEARVAANIVFWKEHEKGGHFPSLERPQDLVDDVRTFTALIDEDTLKRLRGGV